MNEFPISEKSKLCKTENIMVRHHWILQKTVFRHNPIQKREQTEGCEDLGLQEKQKQRNPQFRNIARQNKGN